MRVKEILIKIGWHIVFLLGLYVLQTSLFSRLFPHGSIPSLLPIAVSGIALFQGKNSGGVFGIAAGAIWDAGSAADTVMFILLFAAMGILIGVLSERVLTRGFPSYLLCAVSALLISAFFQMFSFLVFDRIAVSILATVTLKQTLCSMIFILPLYFPIRRISRRIRPL